jgi:hypothetical protein
MVKGRVPVSRTLFSPPLLEIVLLSSGIGGSWSFLIASFLS